jgi:hypothetical protein
MIGGSNMNKTISRLLGGNEDNHLLPFFWQHGEDEAILRKYVNVIHDANCGAFCVESRPHPDFCGPKWWADMDAILDEAKKLGMKVWILDDSHFPTGFANGAVENAPAQLCRQSVCAVTNGKFPPKFTPNVIERFMPKSKRVFSDDTIIAVTKFGKTYWTVGLTRNLGYHRNYINMLSRKSVRLLIDAVYEKHYERYSQYFGNVIEGFFSDEPEFGNAHMYDSSVKLGTPNDFPFSDEIAVRLEESLGKYWAEELYLLWENNADKEDTRRVRLAYMDAITKTVREDFSFQIGDWCRAHGVKYIGHIIEDNGQHARTGSSLGHYFRSLEGQDMSGIDDIGGQVLPQGENMTVEKSAFPGKERNASFFHFMLGRLASSAAAIEPLKQGRAMCEIFGNYGWAEGVFLEKYLADHFMVRGVNYFVPHAFSPKAFPDPDCPPHFYAHGHNPQYRHFAALMKYMNRVCNILSSGTRVATTAIVYHAEEEWQGNDFTPNEKMAKLLEGRQISFDIVPKDYFDEPNKYIDRKYKTVIGCQTSTVPEGLIPEVTLSPKTPFMRVCHITGESEIYYFFNEGARYSGEIEIPQTGFCYAYNAWDNRMESLETSKTDVGTTVKVFIEARKSLIVVFSNTEIAIPIRPAIQLITGSERVPLAPWTRSICESLKYPKFKDEKTITLPDKLADEKPKFSGFALYKTSFETKQGDKLLLVVDKACEGVEVFLNGKSAGIQIVPAYRYDLTDLAQTGKNELRIEVATTLERKCYPPKDITRRLRTPKPYSGSGLTGNAILYRWPAVET